MKKSFTIESVYVISKALGVPMYMMFETKKEQQIMIDQKKTLKFRPIISEAVKKSVILRDEKQRLHKMRKQLLNYQEQQSVNQETEYEEKSHGMSM